MITSSAGKTFYKFTLGEMECYSVFDGHTTYPSKNIFANAPSSELTPLLEKRNIPENKISIPFRCLLIKYKDNIALLDTGLGSDIIPTAGQLLENLRQIGVPPESIDTVIFSHGHIDHIGGAVTKDGNPSFPNARYLMGRKEYMFWLSDLAIEMVGESVTHAIRNKLTPLQNKLNFIEPNQEIIPGLRSFAAPGHTPFSLGFVLSADSRKAYYLAFSVMHPIHLEKPDWYTEFDTNPLETLNTKGHLLKQVSTENNLVVFYHFPYPGVGYVHSKPDGTYEWSPMT